MLSPRLAVWFAVPVLAVSGCWGSLDDPPRIDQCVEWWNEAAPQSQRSAVAAADPSSVTITPYSTWAGEVSDNGCILEFLSNGTEGRVRVVALAAAPPDASWFELRAAPFADQTLEAFDGGWLDVVGEPATMAVVDARITG